MKRIIAAYRTILVIAVFLTVAVIGLGQVSLNQPPREDLSLEQPLFSFQIQALEPLCFSLGGKLHNLAFFILAVWIAGCLWDREIRPFRSKLAWAILVFLLVFTLAWVFSPWRDHGWKEGLREILGSGAFALVTIFVLRSPRLQKAAVVILLASVCLSTLGGLYLYQQGVYFPDTAHRIWLSFLHPNAGGSALLLLIPLALAFLLFSSPPWVKASAGSLAMIFAAAMLLTFSRTAWISLLVGFFVLSCRWPGRWYLWGTVALLVFLLVVGASAGSRSFLQERVGSVFDLSRDVNLHKRLIYWEGTARRIAQRPLLGYGTGYETFMTVWEEYEQPLIREPLNETPIHPHNLYLSLGFSAGLLG
ncbi:MAG: O-antigen ligase family protein, partial [Candidatus Aureabacteria bacterium]|nr:O-antigen ligase family protein [Candidatus Auribacterota bacterium]